VSDATPTGRELVAELVEGSPDLYRLLLETSIDPIAVLADDGTFVFASPGYEALVGWRSDELLGMNSLELVHPDDLARVDEAVSDLRRAGQAQVEGVRIRRADGSYAYVAGSGRTLELRDGSTYLVTFAHDLTESRRVADELRASEERYRGLVEGIEAVVWEANARSFNFTFVSPRAVEVLGYPLEDWYEPGFWLARLHPDDRERTYAECLDAVERAVDHVLEYRMVSSSGRAVWLRDLVRVDVVDGKVELLRGVMVDVTAQVEAAQERERLEGELRQAQKLEAIGRLAGGIAHDFNNMLTAIGGYAELAIEDTESAGVRTELEHIRTAAERAAGLTRQLLAFSRRQQLRPEVVDLNEVVADMGAMLQRLIGADVELVIDLGSGVKRTLVDPTQVQQVVLNLAVNARDAMPEGGRLDIRTENLERDGRAFVALTVSDTGVGMDEETLERVFEPFFTTKPVGEGTGLGLATVHGIAKQSGGDVEVESEPGRGTRFRILLSAVD
jgi:two-component system, cell cycle sensor histidine kinase and response regulator CckA